MNLQNFQFEYGKIYWLQFLAQDEINEPVVTSLSGEAAFYDYQSIKLSHLGLSTMVKCVSANYVMSFDQFAYGATVATYCRCIYDENMVVIWMNPCCIVIKTEQQARASVGSPKVSESPKAACHCRFLLDGHEEGCPYHHGR